MMDSLSILYALKENKILLWNKDADQIGYSFDKLIGFPNEFKQFIKENKEAIREILIFNNINTEQDAKLLRFYRLPDGMVNKSMRGIQLGMFLQSLLDSEKAVYTIPLLYRMKNVTIGKLEKAIIQVLKNNRILTLKIADNNTFEFINPENIKIQKMSLIEAAINEYCFQAAQRSFPDNDNLFLTIRIIEIENTNDILLDLTHHHVLSEANSVNFIIQEILKYYGNASFAEINRLDYFDYQLYMDSQLESIEYQEKISVLSKLLSEAESLSLMRKYSGNHEAAECHFKIDEIEILNNHCIENQISLYSVLVSAWYYVLHQFSGEQINFPLGLTVSNRLVDFDHAIGPFISTLPLIPVFNPNASMVEVFQQIHSEISALNQFHCINLNLLNEYFKDKKDQFANIITVLFTFHNFESAKDLNETNRIPMPEYYEKFGISLTASQRAGSLHFTLTYKKHDFEVDYINSLINAYLQALLSIKVKSWDNTLNAISLLNDEDYKRTVLEFNNTEKLFDDDQTIQGLFEKQAELTPNNIAITYQEKSLNYSIFNNKINQVAHYLREKYHIKNNDFIGVYLQRSEHLLISIYAILKCGAAYVPIDPDYPALRTQYIINDSALKLIISEEKYYSVLVELTKAEILQVDNKEIQTILNTYSSANPLVKVDPSQIAYVIYTSGTTGKPKGVLVPHRGIVNRIQWMNSEYPLTYSDKLIQKTPTVFDVSVWELFWAQWYGAELVISEPDGHKDPVYLMNLIVEKNITVIHFVPSMLDPFLQYCREQQSKTRLRYLFCSGEALKVEQVKFAHTLLPETGIHNLYGPTEASIDVLYYDCRSENYKKISIGKPIWNTTAYILNSALKPLPYYAIGELHIGGVGLARGYHNLPELTASKFITNPITHKGRLYKTGDKVRRLANDNIEYIDRADFQVKLRGFRIELSEIEMVLLNYEGINQVVVLVRDNRIVAYYVSPITFAESALENYCKKHLPVYMIPTDYVCLESMPTTSNGKLDRNQLPMPVFQQTEKIILPRNSIEETVQQQFSKVLGVETKNISIFADFFKLGGDSILSIQVVGLIKQILKKELSVKDIYQLRTVAEISDKLSKNTNVLVNTDNVERLSGEVLLLPIQKWFFLQNFDEMNHWNQSFIVKIPYELEKKQLLKSINTLVEHHDAFRLRFQKNDQGSISQEYKESLKSVSVRFFNINELNDLENHFTEWQSDFDIEKGDVCRFVYLYGYSDGGSKLFVACHHLIIDTVSWYIIIKDLGTLYRNKTLTSKSSSYQAWSTRINDYELIYQDEKLFWNKIVDKTRDLNLQLSKYISNTDNSRHGCFELDGEITQKLTKQVNRIFHTETQELIIAALILTLSEITTFNEWNILMEGHGRETLWDDLDVSDTIGWFTSLFPIAYQVNDDLLLLIDEVKTKVRTIPNKGLGYGSVIGYEDQVLPNIFFNYLGTINSNTQHDSQWSLEKSGLGICMKNKSHQSVLLNMLIFISEGKLICEFDSRLNSEFNRVLIEKFQENIFKLVKLGLTLNEQPYGKYDFVSIQSERDLSYFPIIKSNNANEWFTMTEIQKAYLLGRMESYEIGNTANHVYSEFYYSDLNIKKLETVVNKLISHYPALRTVFCTKTLKQKVMSLHDIGFYQIKINDFKASPANSKDLTLVRDRLSHHLYDAEHFPLFTFEISQFQNEIILHVSFDLLILDVQSRMALFEDMTRLYHDDNYQLNLNGISFQQYLTYMDLLKQSAWYKNDKRYWEKKIPNMPQRPTLRFSMAPEKILQPLFFEDTCYVSQSTWLAFKAKVESHKLSVSAVLLAIFGKIIAFYSGKDEFIITLTLFNRYMIDETVPDIYGDFTSTNLFHFINHEDDFIKTIINTHDNLFEDLQHALYSGIQVQRDLSFYQGLDISKAVSPIIFTSVIGDKHHSFDKHFFLEENEMRDKRYWMGQTSQAWIDLQAVETEKGLMSKWLYVSQLFSSSYITALNSLFCKIIESLAVSNWEKSLNLPRFLPDLDAALITKANNAVMKIENNSLHDYYFKNIKSHNLHEKTAVIDSYKNQILTHDEVIKQSQLLAKAILKLEKSSLLIAILSEKGSNQVLSALGIMTAGHAYLPLHVEWPYGRIKDVLEQGKVDILLVSQECYENFEFIDLLSQDYHIIVLEDMLKSLLSKPENYIDQSVALPHVKPSDTAYVIFTSGSTGKPKGVEISHEGALNTIIAVNEQFKLSHVDKVLALSELSFDLSVYDIFGLLSVGGAIVFPKQSQTKDPDHWRELIKMHQISIWNTVPQLADLLIDALHSQHDLVSLRLFLLSGDWIPLALPENIKRILPNAIVTSLGGATEGSIWSIWFEITELKSDWNKIPYGIAMPNQRIYILNKSLSHCPIGVPGEIVIGGIGVALSYWNAPDLTKDKFIDHPVLGQIYKTGDLGQWHQDGYVEFLGRLDHQVKINGYRVELEEIGSVLEKYNGIKQALIQVQDDQLVAYYISDVILDEQSIIAFMNLTLPQYMVPQFYIHLSSLPLTNNGKIDLNALPRISSDIKNIILPQNSLEDKVLDAFCSCLKKDRILISMDDDFFRLGGDSITAIQIVNLLRNSLKCNITIKEIFSLRKINAIVKFINSNHMQIEQKKENKNNKLALLPIQKWFFDQQFKNNHYWNFSVLIKTPILDIKKLQHAVDQLIELHDIFQQRFIRDDKGIFQTINDISKKSAALKVHHDLSILTAWQSEFNLETGPLIQIGYIEFNESSEARVFISCHHIIADLITMSILVSDLQQLYDGKMINPNREKLCDWISVIDHYQKHYQDEKQYWNKILIDKKVIFNEFNDQEPVYHDYEIDEKITQAWLQDVNHVFNTTSYEILLAALNMAISIVTQQDQLVIVLEGHGRDSIEGTIDPGLIVGWLSILFPFKLMKMSDPIQTVKFIKESYRRIPNKGFGFGALLDYAELKNYNIIFNYLGNLDSQSSVDAYWTITDEQAGINADPENHVHASLPLVAYVRKNKLRFESKTRLNRDSFVKLMTAIEKSLRDIIQKLLELKRQFLTPFDLHFDISERQLDTIQSVKQIDAIYLATGLQQAFISHALKQSERDHAYRVQIVWRYNEIIDIDAMRKAWEQMQITYPALRLRFGYDDRLVQIIDQKALLLWTYIDISSDTSEDDKQKCIDKIRKEDREKPFNLQDSPLFRIHFIKVNMNAFYCIFTIHHAITDGWSSTILLTKVHQYYKEIKNQKPISHDIDNAFHQAQLQLQKNYNKDKPYWIKQLSQLASRADLSGLFKKEKKDTKLATYTYIEDQKSISFSIQGMIFDKINEFCQKHGITLNSLLQYCWHKAISVYGSTSTSVVGTVFANRNLGIPGIEKSIGLYLNTLPCIVKHDENKSLIDMLLLCQNQIQAIHDHSHVSLAELPAGNGRLFDSLFMFGNYPAFDTVPQEEKLSIDIIDRIEKRDYPLALIVDTYLERITISLDYAAELFSENSIKRLLSFIENLLIQIVETPDLLVNEIQLISEIDSAIIGRMNSENNYISSSLTFIDYFKRQAELTPSNIALRCNEEEMTYQQLDKLSTNLAFYLLEKQIEMEDRIALCFEKNTYFMVSLLAVMKTGAAYVLIEKESTKERLEKILKDSDAKILLSESALLNGEWEGHEILVNKSFIEKLNNNVMKSFNSNRKPNGLLYLLFTSGSTGEPKGVMIEDSAFIDTVLVIKHEYFSEQQELNTFSTTNIVFDIFGLEYALPLISGGTLYLGSALFDKIDCHDLAFIQMTPALCDVALERLYHTENTILFLGGEALPLKLLQKSFSKFETVINFYGPTETTIWSTAKLYHVSDRDLISQVTIGKPFKHEKAFILNKSNMLIPAGAVGELFIGGSSLARGYYKNPLLTEDKFIIHPQFGRLYKTGDLASIDEVGDIYFLGRNDFQVKINGHRIDLSEIESHLLAFSGILQTVVTADSYSLEENSDAAIIAYYTASKPINDKALISYLSGLLPHYMIPSIFIRMDKIPLNINGKIDRKALPKPEIKTQHDRVKLAYSTIDTELISLWEEVLNVKNISVEDNFFDIGGNSLLLIKLYNKLPGSLKDKIKVVDLFKYPTLSALFKYMRDENDAPKSNHEPIKIALNNQDIAVIGMAGRFPDAEDIDEFWNNLKNGHSSVQFYSHDELSLEGISETLLADKNYVCAQSKLRDIQCFDADFFGIPNSEAKLMDPQQRILMECVWHSLEDANYIPDQCNASIGLFAGGGQNNYVTEHIMSSGVDQDLATQYQLMIHNQINYLCTKVAYKLNLTGPVVTVQTGCSTSLVAVHQACNALITGDCDIAVAGGISIGKLSKQGYLYQPGMVFSKDGFCRPFDENSSGTIEGQGVGLVVLKPLNRAIEDKDLIYAVIKGSAINNDGNQKIGYTAPSPIKQAEVISKAIKKAKIKPDAITYIEAHGTGTALGDPIEIQALKEAYPWNGDTAHRCAIGAVKSNIGHLDVAAGITGLIKSVLSIHYGTLVPTLHFSVLNNNIDLTDSAFYINTETKPWIQMNGKRRAGVSSFGIGGTNVHVIVEQAPEKDFIERRNKYDSNLIYLSANSKAALKNKEMQLQKLLQDKAPDSLQDIAYTLLTARSNFKYSRFYIANNPKMLSEQLVRSASHVNETSPIRPIIFVFPGQGTQQGDVLHQLYEFHPNLKKLIENCFEYIRTKKEGDNLVDTLMFPQELVHQTQYTQIYLFIIEYVLAAWLIQLGIKPSAMIGHSIGEFAAACIGGILSLEDAIDIVIERGNLSQQCDSGAMLAIQFQYEKIKPVVQAYQVDLAAINHPDSCVVSGSINEILRLEKELIEKGITVKQLNVSHAFHSYMVEKILPEFENVFLDKEVKQSQIPIISTLTGKYLDHEYKMNGRYWMEHIRKPVLFSNALQSLFVNEKNPLFIEVGCGQVLSHLINQHQFADVNALQMLPVQKNVLKINDGILNLLGLLMKDKYVIDWNVYYKPLQAQKVRLPLYPFDKILHWYGRDKQIVIENHKEEKIDFDSTRSAINAIWLDVIGKEPDSIQDDFYQSGGDSLLVVRLQHKLANYFNVPLELAIMDCLSIEKIEIEIQRLQQSIKKSQTCILKIQQGSKTGESLILIHPIGGDIFYYKDLCRDLLKSVTVYAIRSPVLSGRTPFNTIEEMADYYINEINRLNIKAPYRFGGSSFGGIVAFQMAQMMKNQGKQVLPLMMIDTPCYGNLPSVMKENEILLYLAKYGLNDLMIDHETLLNSESVEEKIQYLSGLAQSTEIAEMLDLEFLPVFIKLWVNHARLMQKYIPKIYEGDIVFFSHEEVIPEFPTDQEKYWRQYCNGNLEKIIVPGNHITMNKYPFVKKISMEINKLVNETLLVEG